MADDLSGQERQQQLAAHEAAGRQRDDAFSRLLGDQWVEVEPGIYRKQTGQARSAGSAGHEDADAEDAIFGHDGDRIVLASRAAKNE